MTLKFYACTQLHKQHSSSTFVVVRVSHTPSLLTSSSNLASIKRGERLSQQNCAMPTFFVIIVTLPSSRSPPAIPDQNRTWPKESGVWNGRDKDVNEWWVAELRGKTKCTGLPLFGVGKSSILLSNGSVNGGCVGWFMGGGGAEACCCCCSSLSWWLLVVVMVVLVGGSSTVEPAATAANPLGTNSIAFTFNVENFIWISASLSCDIVDFVVSRMSRTEFFNFFLD